MRKFFKEFKEFISRGNVVDLAVAVIVGGAFGKIVSSLVSDIIMPLICAICKTDDVSNLFFKINSTPIYYGKFIQAIIDFLIISFFVFLLIKLLMGAQNASKKLINEAKHELSKEERKALKKQGLSRKEIHQKEIEARAARIAREEEEKKNAKPADTTESLLKEIRDLLAAQNKDKKEK